MFTKLRAKLARRNARKKERSIRRNLQMAQNDVLKRENGAIVHVEEFDALPPDFRMPLGRKHFLYVAADDTVRVSRIGKPFKVAPKREEVLVS